jgi:hypothetical protein
VDSKQDNALPSLYIWFWVFSVLAVACGMGLIVLGGGGIWRRLAGSLGVMNLGTALATIAAGVAATWIGMFGLIVIDIRRQLRQCQTITFALPGVVADRLVAERSDGTVLQSRSPSASRSPDIREPLEPGCPVVAVR